jgi:hypothetical protein
MPKKQFMLHGIDKLVDQIDCGQAASFLMHTDLATIGGYDGLSTLTAPNPGQAIATLDYQEPFARRHPEIPHIVSFDLDQLPYFCDKEYNKYVGDYVGLDAPSTTSYFEWLNQAGLNSTHIDAVCAYTSPGYIEPRYSLDGFRYLVNLFDKPNSTEPQTLVPDTQLFD